MFGSDMQFFSIVIMFNGQTALFSKLTNLKKKHSTPHMANHCVKPKCT